MVASGSGTLPDMAVIKVYIKLETIGRDNGFGRKEYTTEDCDDYRMDYIPPPPPPPCPSILTNNQEAHIFFLTFGGGGWGKV